jgi:hypothetical protein
MADRRRLGSGRFGQPGFVASHLGDFPTVVAFPDPIAGAETRRAVWNVAGPRFLGCSKADAREAAADPSIELQGSRGDPISC